MGFERTARLTDDSRNQTNDASPITGYCRDAQQLIPAYEALCYSTVFAPVQHLFPAQPTEVLDVGAGTGRAAAWFADRGHRVCAVEPVAAFRDAGQARHPSTRIQWLDDRLPDLSCLSDRKAEFGLVILVGVWQHIPEDQRDRTLAVLSTLLRPNGRLILSVRHGPGAPSRPVFQSNPDDITAMASAQGLTGQFRTHVPSIQKGNQAAGVTWTWLAYDKGTISEE